MTRKIIDIHAHLGHLMYGKNVMYKQNAVMKDMPDPFIGHEKNGFEGPLIGPDPKEFEMLVDASNEKCNINTLQNLQKSMDKSDIDYVCLMPICPMIYFEEYLGVSLMDPRLVPFTSADFSLKEDAGKKLLEDVKKGAKGLKIHPVSQNISLTGKLVEKALEYWEETGLPVLSHNGANQYYYGEDVSLCTPEFGDVKYFIELVKKFPNINFIAGHAGGLMGGEMEVLAEETANLGNVYVDTTFRSVTDVKKLIELFGRERVMYGTDSPFSTHEGSLKVIDTVIGDDRELEKLLLFENANRLLKLE